MDVKAYVLIHVRRADGTSGGGTGYRLGPDRVLTAGHVVQGCEAVEIHFDGAGGSVCTVAAKVVWEVCEDSGLDAAVLAFEPPAGLPVAVAWLAEGPLATQADWQSRGWATAALAGTSVADSLVPFSGKAYPAAAHALRLQLQVEPWPDGAEGWKGISGAPVFVGSRIFGVLGGAPKDFAGRQLHASPLHHLLACEGFREKAGLERADRWQGLEEEIRQRLLGDQEAAKAIAAERPAWGQALGQGEDALAAAICQRSEVAEVLEAMHEAHLALIGDKKRAAACTVAEILARVVPLLFERQLVYALPAGPGAIELRVPVSTSTLAELALAAVDGRGYRYKPQATGDTFPEPALAVASFPEPGFDVTGDRAFHNFLDHLAKDFTVQQDRDRLLHLPDAKRYRQLAKLVNGELEWRARGRAGLRRYFLFDGRFARDHAAFLALVRPSLTALRLVELAGEDLADLENERQLCRPLRDLLHREHHHPP